MRSPWTATSASRTASGVTTLPFLIRRSNTAGSSQSVSFARQSYYACRDGGKGVTQAEAPASVARCRGACPARAHCHPGVAGGAPGRGLGDRRLAPLGALEVTARFESAPTLGVCDLHDRPGREILFQFEICLIS